MRRMGRGWAKGLAASTDGRVARAAIGHIGLTYRPRSGPGRRTLPLVWCDELAYVVGLLATDGCLISGRTQIAFVSADRELCETLRELIGVQCRIRETITYSGGRAYRMQFGDAAFYRWLLAVGLTPRKSLTLGAIDVPIRYISALVRGLLDGDGSIVHYWHDGTGKASGRYEALRVRFCTASEAHVTWLREVMRSSFGVHGWITSSPSRDGARRYFYLAYGNRESVEVLKRLYADVTAPRLERKRATWLAYFESHEASVR